MKKYQAFLILLLFIIHSIHGQEPVYSVKRTSFSSRITNEFAPVPFRQGVVFCSDMGNRSIVSYNDNQHGLTKIYYVARSGKNWKPPVMLSDKLTSVFHDGPITFCLDGKLACFSRNNNQAGKFGNISDTTNKLGLYLATLDDDQWTDIRLLEFSDNRYNYTTPSFSPDGNRIYFSSDKPGGCGGMDLYYSERAGDSWSPPINLGKHINTPGNESFPFVSENGKMYFASDGYPGLGGKDIYYTEEINSQWIKPVHLESEINSPADDFGFMTDSIAGEGFFSSNRLKTDDIFSFSLIPVAFATCDTIDDNNFCYTFFDERQHQIDTVSVTYSWDFGNGTIIQGKEVRHCFPGPGSYTVKLTITDDFSGKPVADPTIYNAQLENANQAIIRSDNIGFTGKPLSFEASLGDLKGLKAYSYWWNFGEGFNYGGPITAKIFDRKGQYTVKLGLVSENDSIHKCFLKNIRIFNSMDAIPIPEIPVNKQAGTSMASLKIKVFAMDNLTTAQKQSIEKWAATSTLSNLAYENGNFTNKAYKWIDQICDLIMNSGEIRMETIVCTGNKSDANSVQVSAMLANQLEYNLKKHGLPAGSFECSMDDNSKNNEGIITIFFMSSKISMHE